MSVISAEPGLVCAYEPQPEDHFVQVVWHGPHEDGRHLRAFEGPVRPIKEYQVSLNWALSMAGQMRCPIHVVPMPSTEALSTEYLRRGLADLTAEQRGKLRHQLTACVTQIMRDCPELETRAAAYDVLMQIGLTGG